MIVRGASRPGGTPPGQDRWTATERSIIVLDGASAFDQDAPPADTYVDVLLALLAERIDSTEPLTTVLAGAIKAAAERVQVDPGAGPSSTVALLRDDGESIEVAALGDSTILVGLADGRTERITDDRMSAVAVPEREHYRDRLRGGSGYDAVHRATLSAIQAAERSARNEPAGYWIAEADPTAARHALTTRYRRSDVAWCVLATDGAQRGFDHLGIAWADLPRATPEALASLLDELHSWESDYDPSGARLPRAKRHDDKTVATWTAE